MSVETLVAPRLWSMVFAALLSLLVSCDGSSGRDQKMTLPADLQKVTTRCIGRYLVDIPDVFIPTAATYAQFYYGLGQNFRTVDFSVPVASGGQSALDAWVAKRVGDLRSTYHFESASKNMLAADRHLDDGSRLIRAYKDSRSSDILKSELYSRQGPATALFSRPVYPHENGDEIDASLIKIASKSSYMAPGATAGRGACLGQVTVDAGQDAEIFHPSFQSVQYPDVIISIDMNSVVAESDGGLFARVNAKSDLLAKLLYRSDVLRKDKMTIGGRPAEEILEAGKDHDKIVRSFTAETVLSSPSTFAQPLISIDMVMGGQVKNDYRDASLTEAQALALWDAIVKSIRIRPGSL